MQGTGGGNVVVRRNFIDIVDHGRGHGGEPNSAFQIGTEWDSNSNWTHRRQLAHGGGWVINAAAGNGSGNRIANNRFGRGVSEAGTRSSYPGYGPISTNGAWSVSGNVWDDTGLPVSP